MVILRSQNKITDFLMILDLCMPDPQPSKLEVLNQCWFDTGPASLTVGQNWVNVSCLLGVLTGYIVFRTSPVVKILKLLPNWLSLKTIFYCRYKKTCSSTAKYIVSTVHRSHLITLNTKSIDTTSISYQPLWLSCWRGDISSFLSTKN